MVNREGISMKSIVCEGRARVSVRDRDEVKSEKPNDLSARLGQPSSRQADEHNGLGRLGVPLGDGRVCLVPA